MEIQIERISAQSIIRRDQRCAQPLCTAAAAWSLVDRGMPDSNTASMGALVCCMEHIPVTYLGLRGAHLLARAVASAHLAQLRQGTDRSRRRKRKTLANLAGHVVARGIG